MKSGFILPAFPKAASQGGAFPSEESGKSVGVSLPEPSFRSGGSLAQDALKEKLWALVRLQARAYTQGDSDSLPQETAEELLASLLYTLRRAYAARGLGLEALVQEEGTEALGQAQALLEKDLDHVKLQYAALLPRMVLLEHQALRDTLGNIGVGLRQYNLRFFAHQEPCEIDYQLCLPVPETLLGLDYVKHYLLRLQWENELLRAYDSSACAGLLDGRFPLWRELLLNLYEPVLARGVGRILAGQEAWATELPAPDFARLPKTVSGAELSAAAVRLCRGLGLDAAASAYAAQCAEQLQPRYQVAMTHGTIENVL